MKQTSTKLFLLSAFSCLLFSADLRAQEQASGLIVEDSKNIVKMNVGALLLNNFSFQYERAIGEKTSVAASIRFAPKAGVPFKSKLEDLIDDEDAWESIKDFKTGNFAITPEVRFYLGKSVFRGFYIAPFARYATYSASVPFKFDVQGVEQEMPLSGDVTALTAGVLFGAQWKLSKLVYFDWWIAGPNYGFSNGSISGKKSLSQPEQDALRDELEELEDLPLVKSKYTVDANGAKVDFDGPWAGLRAGLSVGFRF